MTRPDLLSRMESGAGEARAAPVTEIFTTVQGEGPYTGEAQIFVRFAGCPLRCDYCDTPASLVPSGGRPMAAEDALAAIRTESSRSGVRTVSLTGGEPLVYASFIRALAAELKRDGFRLYLETAGVHPGRLRDVIEFMDVVSMDVKLPSATGREHWAEHEAFLEAAGDKAFAKIVLERHSTDEEFDRAVSLLAAAPRPPLTVLQPVTPKPPHALAPSAGRVAELYGRARGRLPRVFVMTQQHKAWNIR